MTVEKIDLNIEVVNVDRKATPYFETLWFELTKTVNFEVIEDGANYSYKFEDGRLINFLTISEQIDLTGVYASGGFFGDHVEPWPVDFVGSITAVSTIIPQADPQPFSITANPVAANVSLKFLSINSTAAANCGASVIAYGSWK